MVLGIIMIFPMGIAFALATEDLIRLKKSGIPEDIIVFMVENDYRDVDKVVKLKEAGFKDESIHAIIKNELKGSGQAEKNGPEMIRGVQDEKSIITTTARIKIMWYLVYRGEPVLQNSQAINNVKISAVNNTLEFEWEDKGGLGLLDLFRKKPFKSPFYWNIGKDDKLEIGAEGHSFKLISASGHKGSPETDSSHYWVIYLEPKDPKIIDYIKNSL